MPLSRIPVGLVVVAGLATLSESALVVGGLHADHCQEAVSGFVQLLYARRAGKSSSAVGSLSPHKTHCPLIWLDSSRRKPRHLVFGCARRLGRHHIGCRSCGYFVSWSDLGVCRPLGHPCPIEGVGAAQLLAPTCRSKHDNTRSARRETNSIPLVRVKTIYCSLDRGSLAQD